MLLGGYHVLSFPIKIVRFYSEWSFRTACVKSWKIHKSIKKRNVNSVKKGEMHNFFHIVLRFSCLYLMDIFYRLSPIHSVFLVRVKTVAFMKWKWVWCVCLHERRFSSYLYSHSTYWLKKCDKKNTLSLQWIFWFAEDGEKKPFIDDVSSKTLKTLLQIYFTTNSSHLWIGIV